MNCKWCGKFMSFCKIDENLDVIFRCDDCDYEAVNEKATEKNWEEILKQREAGEAKK